MPESPSIQKIDAKDMPPMRSGGGGTITKQGEAVKNLSVGDAVKMGCIWRHINGGCRGHGFVGQIAHRHNRRFRATCQGGFLYVMRIAVKEQDARTHTKAKG